MPQSCNRWNTTNISASTATVHCPSCNTSSPVPDAVPLPPLTQLPLPIQSDFIPYDHDSGLLTEEDDDDDLTVFNFIEDDNDFDSFIEEYDDFIEEDEDFDTTVDWTSEADHYEPIPTPAATSFINAIKAEKVSVTSHVLKQDLDTESSCVICSDGFQVKESVNQMSCNHWFHSECIVKWLNLKNTCPLCRYEFPVEITSEMLQSYIETRYYVNT